MYLKSSSEPSIVAPIYNLNTWEAKAGEFQKFQVCLERKKKWGDGDRWQTHKQTNKSSHCGPRFLVLLFNLLSVDVPSTSLSILYVNFNSMTLGGNVIAHSIRKTLGCFLLISLANYNKCNEYAPWRKGLKIKTQCSMKIRLTNLRRKTSSINAWHVLEDNGSHSRTHLQWGSGPVVWRGPHNQPVQWG